MATTMYFEETIKGQGGEDQLEVELGTSSFYDDHSIYLVVEGKGVVMDIETAKRFVDAVVSVGQYYGYVKR